MAPSAQSDREARRYERPSQPQRTDFAPLGYRVVLISIGGQLLVGLSLFARSGSLLVAMSVLAEFSLLRGRDIHHSAQLQELAEGRPVDFAAMHPSRRHQALEWLAHITSVLEAIIWGCGDLAFG